MHPTLLALFLLGMTAAPAPPAVPSPAPAPAPPTLDAALHAMRPPQDVIALAVGADKVTLPKDGVAPGAGADPADVAEAYGVLTRSFGSVLAVAPRTMTLVYAPPATPNPYDGMPPKQVLKMLARTFTPAQWKAFMSDAGVGYDTMQEGAQQNLFQALFPGGHLVAQLDNPTGPNDPNAKRDLSGDALRQAHLRVGYIVAIALPVPGKPNEHLFASTSEPPNAPALYFMMNAQSDDVDHEFGATVRETGPNDTKPGALPQAAHSVLVPVGSGLKTVDDLCARVSRLAHCEIYADPRYGTRPLTLVGGARAARGDDLLRAVALCVRGAYRKVGPAYVLTDDAVGLGTKHALWKAFEEKAAAMLPGQGQFSQGSPIAGVPFTRKDIPVRDDPLAFTPAQQSQYWKQQEGQEFPMGGGMLQLTLPFGKLSPAQQEAAQQTQEENEKRHFDTSLEGTFMLQAEPELQIVLPALDGPVVVFQSYENLLPEPARSPASQAALNKRMEAEFPSMARPDLSVPPGALARTLAGFARRAVRIAPKTPQSLTHLLGLAHNAGFNEVWLQTTPGTVPPGLLAQAVAEGKPLGLRVLPELSLLRLPDAAHVPPDLDVMGNTTVEADALMPSHMYSLSGIHNTASPFDLAVVESLQTEITSLAATPGIGGMVWDDFVPHGYESGTERLDDYDHHALGYAEAGRIAFLRAAHADPIDVYDNSHTDERANLAVPGFDARTDSSDRALFEHWRSFRSAAALALAHRLTRALPASFQSAAAARLPLLASPANNGFTDRYGSWDNLQSGPPTVQFIPQTRPDGTIIMGVPVTERMASSLQYRIVQMYAPPRQSASEFAGTALAAFQGAAKAGAHCILCDSIASPDLLESLARAVAVPPAPHPSAKP